MLIMADLGNPRWHIDPDEKFIVISGGLVSNEYLRSHHSDYNRLGQYTVQEVGPRYLGQKATFVVTSKELVVVMRAAPPGGHLVYPGGISFRAVSPGEFTDLILAAAAV